MGCRRPGAPWGEPYPLEKKKDPLECHHFISSEYGFQWMGKSEWCANRWMSNKS
jgi:hypothetical protein